MRLQRMLLPLSGAVVAIVVLACAFGPGTASGSPTSGLNRARVLEVPEEGTTDLGAGPQTYQLFQIEVLDGAYAGIRFTVDYGRRQVVSEGEGVRAGEEVLVSVALSPTGRVEAYFADFVRITPILGLALVFVVLILVVSRGKGLRALIGMLLSLAVIGGFILPAILSGQTPSWSRSAVASC